MGRHAAHDGAGVDPIVAAALGRRPAAAAGTPQHGVESGPRALSAANEGGLGWPGDPADGTGLGWPAEQAAGGRSSVGTAAPARRRTGWRRLFGGSRTAA